MQKIDFVYGNEKRFDDFIKLTKDAKKIALISHVDLDGLGSAMVVNDVVKLDLIKFVDYKDLNQGLVDELKNNGITHVIITDLYLKGEETYREIEKFAEILVIDHHMSPDYSSDRNYFINASEKGFCTTYMCYLLFSRITNLEKFDWLVACASLSDICYKTNVEWMKEVYEKYGEDFNVNDIKNSKFWDVSWKISLALIYLKDDIQKVFDLMSDEFNADNLEKYYLPVEQEFQELKKRFEKDKVEIYDGYFWEIGAKYGVKSLMSNWLSLDKYPDKIVIIGKISYGLYTLSYRRQDGKYDMNNLIRKMIEGFENSTGGGHFKAAGGHIQLKDSEEFKKRLKNLKDYLE